MICGHVRDTELWMSKNKTTVVSGPEEEERIQEEKNTCQEEQSFVVVVCFFNCWFLFKKEYDDSWILYDFIERHITGTDYIPLSVELKTQDLTSEKGITPGCRDYALLE